MSDKLFGLLCGVGIGFVFAWAGLSDPVVIREMLLLRSPHVFLLMGAAILVAGIGVRVLRARGFQTLATRESLSWNVEQPQARHVGGSLLFGAGWSLAATCPGPVAVMIGEGNLAGLLVTAGLLAGVAVQGFWARARSGRHMIKVDVPGTAGL